MSPPTVYVHVPFCVVKCGYCDFNSYRPQDEAAELDRYLEGLARSLERRPPPRRPASLFVGGGTPTYLDAPRFERFWQLLGRHLDLAAIAEVTVEANPESVTVEKARLARAAGVNRVSIGVQSFQPDALRFLDRAHGPEAVPVAVEAFRTAGIDNVSLDLISCLPGQTRADWDRDLDAALALEPDHLSCYGLTFEPGTRLTRDLELGRVAPNDEDVDREILLHTRERLGAAGFDAYEISNFAGRGGPCRHNDHYWLQGDYDGHGPGAASHRAGWRGTDLKALGAWADALARGLPPTGEAETLTPRQRAGEAVWLGLRRRDGIDLAAIATRVGVDPRTAFADAITRGVDEGTVVVDGDSLVLTAMGLLHANTVGERFLA